MALNCPNCRRPFVGPLLQSLNKPEPETQHVTCVRCGTQAQYRLPVYVAEKSYVLFGASLLALSLLVALCIDAPLKLRISLLISTLLLWSVGILMFTWHSTRVKRMVEW